MIHTIVKLLRLTRAIWDLLAKESYLSKEGYWRSLVVSKPEDFVLIDRPWFAYSATYYLERFDVNGLSVFEYGGGCSSFYFRSRGAHVHVVEGSKQWSDFLIDNGFSCNFHDLEADYVGAISQGSENKWDIILVDGDFREKCIQKAVDHLKQGGWLILDDFHRIPHKQINDLTFLFEVCIPFVGLGPFSARTQRTLICHNFRGAG